MEQSGINHLNDEQQMREVIDQDGIEQSEQQEQQQQQQQLFTIRQVNVSHLAQKVQIRCVAYMIDNLFALTDDQGQLTIYNTSTYELSQFPNRLHSGRVASFSLRFYKDYSIDQITNESMHVLCQSFFNNTIVFWDISHFQRSKELLSLKIIYTTYDNIYDSVILPDYSLIAVSHQTHHILAFYYHSSQPQKLQSFKKKKYSKIILSEQFGQAIFSIQYDRKRKQLYVGLNNSQVFFYNMQKRQVTNIVTPDINNRYCFDSLLIPRNLHNTNILEECINRKMIDQEYDFEYLLICTDQGIVCINLDTGTVSSNLGGHSNQTRSLVYHKHSNSIFSISCDKRIGIHPLSIIRARGKGEAINRATNPESTFKDTQLKGLCNSISVHHEDIIVVSWEGEIGHYKYERYDLVHQKQLEQLQILQQNYQMLQKLIRDNEALSLQLQNSSQNASQNNQISQTDSNDQQNNQTDQNNQNDQDNQNEQDNQNNE